MPSLLKEVYVLQTSQSFKSSPAFWKHFRKNYRSNFQVVIKKKPGFGNFFRLSGYNLFLQKNVMNFGKFIEHFQELSTALKKVLNFLKFFTIKSEIKTSIERSGCDNCSCRSNGSLIFCQRNVISLGKLILSKFLTLLTYFSSETTNVLSKVHFLKSHFSCLITIANSFIIKPVPPASTGLVVGFY